MDGRLMEIKPMARRPQNRIFLLSWGTSLLALGTVGICLFYRPYAGRRRHGTNGPTNNVIELRIVSMNIASLQSSRAASPDWTLENQTETLMHELLASKPHVICLQECHSTEWIHRSFPNNYTAIGEKRSHAGYVTLLVRNDILSDMERLDLPGSHLSMVTSGTPSVMGISSSSALAVASLHLAPFAEGAPKRKDQLETIINASRRTGMPLITIIAGDMNMRDEEDQDVEQRWRLTDAWKAGGANISTRYTWDTIDHENGTFNEYYGASTRQYRSRYDRIYVHGAAAAAKKVEVASFALLANSPIGTTRNHFLSDHFGIAATLLVHP
jgi:endonuclease/exonuclease/phosphatase family metal-dependent hydrolase